VVSDSAVKSDLIKIKEAQAAPAMDKSALLLNEQQSNYQLCEKGEKPEKDLASENPVPKPLIKPLCKTNQDNTHDVMEPPVTPPHHGNYFGQFKAKPEKDLGS
jgi:hypothetical protein